MNTACIKLADAIRGAYPDMSNHTIVTTGNRAAQNVRRWFSDTIGGILPECISFETYREKKLQEIQGLTPVTEESLLVSATIFFINRNVNNPVHKADRFVRMSRMALEHNLAEPLAGIVNKDAVIADNPEELFRLDMRAFRSFLEEQGLFWPLMEQKKILNISISTHTFFLDLPVMNPVTALFYEKIPSERLFIRAPHSKIYKISEHGNEKDFRRYLHRFTSSIHHSDNTPDIHASEISGESLLYDKIGNEILDFLDNTNGKQLYIVLLDEERAHSLYTRVMTHFDKSVNMAVWFSLQKTTAGDLILEYISETDSEKQNSPADKLREIATAENFLRCEKEAAEAALSLLETIHNLPEELGQHRKDFARIFCERHRFRVTGDQNAPVQVCGITDLPVHSPGKVTLVPMNEGVFPPPLSDMPIFNNLHTPEVAADRFAYHDLSCRQFINTASDTEIITIRDSAAGTGPSWYFHCLTLENELTPLLHIPRQMQGPLPRPLDAQPAISVSNELREILRDKKFSFSSLKDLLDCPFRFYHTRIFGTETPEFLEDRDDTQRQIGEFAHTYFENACRNECGPENAATLFDDMCRETDLYKNSRRKIALDNLKNSILQTAEYEKHLPPEERWFFTAAERLEEWFEGVIPGHQFKIAGKIDKIFRRGNERFVLDYKTGSLSDHLEIEKTIKNLRENNKITKAVQLVIYHCLVMGKYGDSGIVGAVFGHLRSNILPQKRHVSFKEAPVAPDQIRETMRILGDTVENIISGKRLTPDYDSDACRYCRLQSLCKHPDLYRKRR